MGVDSYRRRSKKPKKNKKVKIVIRKERDYRQEEKKPRNNKKQVKE